MTRNLGPIVMCGGDQSPGARDACPDPLHDYPLPSGYVDAAEVAGRRLSRGWRNPRCASCGLYGWVPSLRDVDAERTPAR